MRSVDKYQQHPGHWINNWIKKWIYEFTQQENWGNIWNERKGQKIKNKKKRYSKYEWNNINIKDITAKKKTKEGEKMHHLISSMRLLCICGLLYTYYKSEMSTESIALL